MRKGAQYWKANAPKIDAKSFTLGSLVSLLQAGSIERKRVLTKMTDRFLYRESLITGQQFSD